MGAEGLEPSTSRMRERIEVRVPNSVNFLVGRVGILP